MLFTYSLQYFFSNQGIHHLLLAQYPQEVVFFKRQGNMGIGDGEGAAFKADDEAVPLVTQLRILHRSTQER